MAAAAAAADLLCVACDLLAGLAWSRFCNLKMETCDIKWEKLAGLAEMLAKS